ncbi:tRNA threonylcarbamoyladenosine dehydratase [Rhizosphaericola mali]|uniref:tRNA threonylcarbamoyladenosine dehydratase n=1 Tax=Rhizosphaericola mali TaxID=2545455 RepID=A0A5P2G1F4_9BACT|nr:tRNA threonylcarbamoyladenosine dehydratase [Rhizosphaericola mali]QES87929.1 tRNA threonylcarbamoyladenosine dehydratase [Rhizosphaericola mali]
MTKDTSWLSRTQLIVGAEGIKKLQNAHVLIVGLGGVGSFAAEFVARNGIGKMTIIDGDTVEASNRNRQLPALVSTTGRKKAEIMAERIRDIQPDIELQIFDSFIEPERVAEIFKTSRFDFLIDAIDSITPKITFIELAYQANIPFVSSMGAGGRLDPTRVRVVDISKTFNCPFAQQIRKMLRKKLIYKGFKAVFSDEKPLEDSLVLTDGSNYKKSAFGTMSYMPATFGAVCASVAIRHILEK